MSFTIIPNNPPYVLQTPGIVPATAFDRTFTAADTVNGNAFLATGNDCLIIFNSDSAPHNVILKSAPDPDGRFADITYTVNAGVYSIVNINTASLFTQANVNEVQFTCSSALVGYLVLTNV